MHFPQNCFDKVFTGIIFLERALWPWQKYTALYQNHASKRKKGKNKHIERKEVYQVPENTIHHLMSSWNLFKISRLFGFRTLLGTCNAWKVSKYGVFSGPYLGTFHAVIPLKCSLFETLLCFLLKVNRKSYFVYSFMQIWRQILIYIVDSHFSLTEGH